MWGRSRVCIVGALALAGCNAFTSLEDCERDSDCPLGQRCHPDEDFCEDDRLPSGDGSGHVGSGQASGIECSSGD